MSHSEVRIIGTSGVEGSGEQQLAQPRGICVDAKAKEIYVCDCNNHRIQVYSTITLSFIRQIGRGVQGSVPGCLNYAVGICLDDNNHIFVADTNNHRIVVFNQMTGSFIRTIGYHGITPGALSSPYGVCVDKFSGMLFVADYENHRIQVFNKENGEFVRIIGSGFGAGPGQLNQPIVICIDDDNGNLFVADYCNNRVQVFNKDTGIFIRQIGNGISGISKDALLGPRGLCIDHSSGLLFIADRENHRIQLYNKNTFVFIRHIGSGPGLMPGQFNRPMELCIHKEEGTLLVVDGYNHRVQIIGIPELQSERQRLIANAKKIADMEAKDKYKAKPSKLVMLMQQYDGSNIFIYNNSGASVVRFIPLGPLYDVAVSAEECQILRNQYHIQECSTYYQPKISSIIGNAVDVEAILRQVSMFLSLINDSSTMVPSGEYSLLVPPTLALYSLVDRGWKPKDLSTRTITGLVNLLYNLNLGSTSCNHDERNRTIEAVLSILVSAVSNCNGYLTTGASITSLRIISAIMKNCRIEKHSVGDNDCGDYVDFHIGVISSLVLISHILLVEGYNYRHHDSQTTHKQCRRSMKKESVLLHERQVNNIMLGTSFVSLLNRLKNGLGLGNGLTHGLLPLSSMLENGSTVGALNGGAVVSFASSCMNPANTSLAPKQTIKTCVDIVNLVALIFARSYKEKILPPGSDVELDALNNTNESDVLTLVYVLIEESQHEYINISINQIGSTASNRGGRNVWKIDEPFKVGDLIDAMDKEKSWFESYIVSIGNGVVRVHFMGWGSKWDDDIPESEITVRIAALNTKSKNWRSELFEGGLIEIKCNEDMVNQKWMWGKISALNVAEAWVEVSYSFSHEPIVVKRAELYGETICPIGMHTKDKSKYAAALIVKPSKTVEQLLKDRSGNSDNFNDSSLDDFIDTDDSIYDKDFVCKEFSSGIEDVFLKIDHDDVSALTINPLLYDDVDASGVSGLRYNSLANIADIFNHISLFSFQSIMRSVLLKVSGFIASDASVPTNIKDDIYIKILRSLAKGPFKRLLTPYFLRILTVHIGFRCKLAIGSFLFKHSIPSMNNLMDNVPLMQELLCIVSAMEETFINKIIIVLGDVLTIGTMRYVTDRFKVTIARYAFLPVIRTNFSENDCASYSVTMTMLMTTLLSNLLDHDRFSPVTNVSRKILAYILPTVVKYDNYIIQTTWIDVLQRKATAICNMHQLTNDNDSCESKDEVAGHDAIAGHDVKNGILPLVEGADVLHMLVQLLEKGRSLSRLEFFDSKLCYMATEMAFSKFFASLAREMKVSISRYMATSLNVLMDTRKNKLYPMRVLAKYKEDLLDLIKVLLTEETAKDFCTFYHVLLSKRLLKSRYSSLSSETLMLDELPAMSKARYMIQEIESTSRYMQQFRKYMIHNIDNGIIPYDTLPVNNIYQVILQQGAVEIAVLSGTNIWPSQILSPSIFSTLILPKELATISSEFKSFFESDRFDSSANASSTVNGSVSKRKLIWCHGLGTVTFTCRLNDNSVAHLVGSEPQFALLMAFNDHNRRVSPPRRASPGSSKHNIYMPHSQSLTIESLMRTCGLSYGETLSVVSTLTSPEMQVLEISSKIADDETDNSQLGVCTQLMLSDTLLNGSLGGDDMNSPIILPRHSSNPSTIISLKSVGSQWRMSLIESCITKRLKEISRENSGRFLSIDGIVETTATSLEDLHEYVASCRSTELAIVSLSDTRYCCNRLVEVGIIEHVEGSDKSFSTCGYSYLPITRSNYPSNLPCTDYVNKFTFGMECAQVDQLYRKKESDVVNYKEDSGLLYKSLSELVLKDVTYAYSTGMSYESFVTGIPSFVASLKFTPLEVLVNCRTNVTQSSLIFNADGVDGDEALECDRRAGLISPINVNISNNNYYSNSSLYDIILDITNRCFGSSLLGGYKAFSTWIFHHEHSMNNSVQSADCMRASSDVVCKVMQTLSTKRTSARDVFCVIKVVFQQMPADMIICVLSLFNTLTDCSNVYGADEHGIDLVHEKLDELWTAKYDIIHTSVNNDTISLLFNQDCTSISLEELLASILKYGFLNYNLNGIINSERDIPSRSVRKRSVGKAPVSENGRAFPNINEEHAIDTNESKDHVECVAACDLGASSGSGASYSELVNIFLKRIYEFISINSLTHSRTVDCLELIEGLAVSMHESIHLILSKVTVPRPFDTERHSNVAPDARYFTDLQASKVATIIYDNVSTAGIEIDIWDSCSGVYDNDDLSDSGGSIHEEIEESTSTDLVNNQLSPLNPIRSKKVGYQIFSATVKRLFTIFDARTNDNVLTTIDLVTSGSSIAASTATAINEEVKNDGIQSETGVNLQKYAKEVREIRDKFYIKCQSWSVLDEALITSAWSNGDWDDKLMDLLVIHIYSFVECLYGVLPALQDESDHVILKMIRHYNWDLDEFIDAYSLNSRYIKTLVLSYDESKESSSLQIQDVAIAFASYCSKLNAFKVDGDSKYYKHLRQYETCQTCQHCSSAYHWPLSCTMLNSWNGFALNNRGNSNYYNNAVNAKQDDTLGIPLPAPPVPLSTISSPSGIDNLGNILKKNSTPIGSIPSSPTPHVQSMAVTASPVSGGNGTRLSKFHDLENRTGTMVNHMSHYLSHVETGAAALLKAKEYAALIADARSSNILTKLRIISECWMLLSRSYMIIGYIHLYIEHNRHSHMTKLQYLLNTMSVAVYSLHNMALKILNNNGGSDSSITIARFQLSIFGVRHRLYTTLDEWMLLLNRVQAQGVFGRAHSSISRLINKMQVGR